MFGMEATTFKIFPNVRQWADLVEMFEANNWPKFFQQLELMPSIEGYGISSNSYIQIQEEEDRVVLLPFNNFYLKLT